MESSAEMAVYVRSLEAENRELRAANIKLTNDIKKACTGELDIERMVHHLNNRRALHTKKKFRAGTQTWKDVIDHLWEEIEELEQAEQILDPADRKIQMISELGDILGCLMSAIIKGEFKFRDVEKRGIAKLKERFQV